MHILHLKIGIKVRADGQAPAVLLGDDDREGFLPDLGVVLRLLALLGEALGPDELRVREGGRPFGQEDVVLDVGRDEVADVAAEGGDLGLCGFGEGYGGEDGEGTRGEADWGWLAD